MGIRPDRMQALAWGLGAAGAGIAGALMAISLPLVPLGRRNLWPHRVRSGDAGRFRQRVPGALYAGLIDRPDPGAVSAYWLGPIYKDIVVYALFAVALLFRAAAAGPDRRKA